jgi:hypothetical protein
MRRHAAEAAQQIKVELVSVRKVGDFMNTHIIQPRKNHLLTWKIVRFFNFF